MWAIAELKEARLIESLDFLAQAMMKIWSGIGGIGNTDAGQNLLAIAV